MRRNRSRPRVSAMFRLCYLRLWPLRGEGCLRPEKRLAMGSASWAHRSLAVAVPSFKGFSGARNRLIYAAFVLAALACVSLTPAAGQSGRWERCRAAKPDASIAACSAIIARGQHEKKSSRIDAYIYRASAYRLKGDLDLAIADLNNALRLSPNMPRALKSRAETYAAKGNID